MISPRVFGTVRRDGGQPRVTPTTDARTPTRDDMPTPAPRRDHRRSPRNPTVSQCELPIVERTPERVRGMARRADRTTSIEAADQTLRRAPSLRQQVLVAFRQLGPMTDETLENLPRFKTRTPPLKPSTIRKRRSELTKNILPFLEPSHRDEAQRMTVWKLTRRGWTEDAT